ncbi:imidazole glycerol phosphate synthase subunit HisH [Magnetospirillum fulvum]|uniref:Imidazole glycerol phosphate synthase subunit HisH n=1 Tax=Magnetospirillum fulvum TaxID=1082 RepID=A0A1H6IWJ4_MAGFU|nr:imidazole glycerol phosphate synthase subunit HisH [Magnetospirillum fulvum]SEH53746.1 glutamine amidotransferase [Magnetospirillum fulvum]
MTQADITIVDYGVGNVLSVARAVTQAGGRPNLSSDPAEIARAERLILPGVGAFGDCIQALRARPGLEQAIRDFAASDRPMLGICVGMQVLFDVGEEFGEHRGLGLIPGRVRAIPATTAEGQPQKVPHIGWSPLSIPDHRSQGWADTILAEIHPGDSFYFVHSFTAWPDDPTHRLADTFHGGQRIAAAVVRGNITGTQFHPEKSGRLGLQILSTFVNAGGEGTFRPF